MNTSTSCWRTGHGDPHPTMVCKANLSRIGASVPHPPATNVISPATNEISPATNVISPTTNKISPALNILINSGVLEDVARRPPSYYGLPRQSCEFFVLHSSLNYTPYSLGLFRHYSRTGASVPRPPSPNRHAWCNIVGQGSPRPVLQHPALIV